jgi:hypothetical protein
MPIIVKRIARVGDGVDAVDVVDVAIAVIVDAVASDLIRIGPHVCRQVWVRVQDACINDEGEE